MAEDHPLTDDVLIANAPVSFGVFELTEAADGLPGPDEVLEAIASSGYAGVDLGPVGYFGDAETIADNLAKHGLALCGGWVDLHLATGDGFDDDLATLDRALDVFEAAAETAPLPPRPTLADSGGGARRAHPGGGADMPELRLDDSQWRAFAERLDEAVHRCHDRGLEPTFHHHVCTHVEAPAEIEQLLAHSDVDLCLDTGHLALGAGDPVQAVDDWWDRINHLHLKDVHLEVLSEVRETGGDQHEFWARNAFSDLGEGDVDLDGFLQAVSDRGYRGWIVVEQDHIPGATTDLARLTEAQRRNRAWLSDRGW